MSEAYVPCPGPVINGTCCSCGANTGSTSGSHMLRVSRGFVSDMLHNAMGKLIAANASAAVILAARAQVKCPCSLHMADLERAITELDATQAKADEVREVCEGMARVP